MITLSSYNLTSSSLVNQQPQDIVTSVAKQHTKILARSDQFQEISVEFIETAWVL